MVAQRQSPGALSLTSPSNSISLYAGISVVWTLGLALVAGAASARLLSSSSAHQIVLVSRHSLRNRRSASSYRRAQNQLSPNVEGGLASGIRVSFERAPGDYISSSDWFCCFLYGYQGSVFNRAHVFMVPRSPMRHFKGRPPTFSIRKGRVCRYVSVIHAAVPLQKRGCTGK